MEALAIAVAMREARHLNKSAALVTPDRALARRVAAALGRWNLEFDDSGGDALTETSAGIFARLAAEAAANGLEPPTLLALLKHPLCRLGGAPAAFKRAIEVLELALLRGTRPQAGSSGLAARLRAISRGTDASSATAKPPRCTVPSRGPGLVTKNSIWRASADRAVAEGAARRSKASARRSRMILPNWQSAIATSLMESVRATRMASRSHSKGRRARRLQPPSTICSARQAPSGLMVELGDYPEVFQTAFGDRIVRRPESAAGAASHLRPAGSAADAIRPHHSGRAGRRRLAAGAAGRSMAEPADAARTRPRFAGAAHRPLRARFCPAARR